MSSPPYMDHTAPRVVKRRQYREYTMVGRFAEAATAKARATRNATFCPWAPMPPAMETTPMTTTVVLATRSSWRGSEFPFLMTLV